MVYVSYVVPGCAFFALGALKLGNVVGFFPRHILVGCIGGIGAFLVETGYACLFSSDRFDSITTSFLNRLTVSTRMDDDEFNFFSLESLKAMFLDKENVTLWIIPLALAIVLRCITYKFHHQLIFPLCASLSKIYLLTFSFSHDPVDFVFIFVVFYIVVFSAHLDLNALREKRWVFDMGETHESWYRFYSYLGKNHLVPFFFLPYSYLNSCADFKAFRIGPMISTLPTQLAL
jgi:SulP family sulfate permease